VILDGTLYDSRDHPSRGIGFPTTGTELDLLPPNLRDPNGYYREIGVNPWASVAEIKARVRQLYRKYHPDTGSAPDVVKFQRIHNIASVLLDPESRAKYDATPQGFRLMDAVYEAELSKLDELYGMDQEELEYVLRPRKARPYDYAYEGVRQRYDFFAINHRTSDSLTANLWYSYLVAYASEYHYHRVIKILLHDGSIPAWDSNVAMVMIPRAWQPNAERARQLLEYMTTRVTPMLSA